MCDVCLLRVAYFSQTARDVEYCCQCDAIERPDLIPNTCAWIVMECKWESPSNLLSPFFPPELICIITDYSQPQNYNRFGFFQSASDILFFDRASQLRFGLVKCIYDVVDLSEEPWFTPEEFLTKAFKKRALSRGCDDENCCCTFQWLQPGPIDLRNKIIVEKKGQIDQLKIQIASLENECMELENGIQNNSMVEYVKVQW